MLILNQDVFGNKQNGPGVGVVCTAGNAQIADLTNNTKVNVTTVAAKTYMIFAPMIGIVVVGQAADPKTVANIAGIIPPGGTLIIKATGTTLQLYCKDSADDYGSDFDGTAYVVLID